MKNMQIRKLTISDMERIRELLQTREELDSEGAEKRAQLLEWIAFRNPFANGEATYFVVEDSGKIVAHMGRMPTEFIINGRLQRGYFTHDLYVHPQYIKSGKGFFISMALYKAIEESTDSFCCGIWTSPLNLRIQRLRRYYELRAHRYVKLLDPRAMLLVLKKESFVKMFAPILRIILVLVDSILFRINSRKVRIKEIERFDSRFDELNQKILQKIGISSFKHSSYLNWKYIDRPYRRNRVFAVEDGGQVLGFVVVASKAKTGYPKGTILDIMANPEDTRTISSLCKAAIDYFKKQKVYSIHCYLTDKRIAKVFKRFLFLKVFSDNSIMLANLEKCHEKRDYMIDIDNWHLTDGESDGFMLRP